MTNPSLTFLINKNRATHKIPVTGCCEIDSRAIKDSPFSFA